MDSIVWERCLGMHKRCFVGQVRCIGVAQIKKGVWGSQMCIRGGAWVKWLHGLSGVQEGGEVRKNAWRLQGCIYFKTFGRNKIFPGLKKKSR